MRTQAVGAGRDVHARLQVEENCRPNAANRGRNFLSRYPSQLRDRQPVISKSPCPIFPLVTPHFFLRCQLLLFVMAGSSQAGL